MRVFVTLSIVLATLSTASTQEHVSTAAPCPFTVRYQAPSGVTVTAAPEVAAMYRHWQPPESPIVVTMVDLSEVELTASPGAYLISGPSRVEVMNVSDRTVSEVQVMLHVGWGTSGSGRGQTLKTPLPPGERATLVIGRGRGHGTNHSTSLPTIAAHVTRTTVGDCIYIPARMVLVH